MIEFLLSALPSSSSSSPTTQRRPASWAHAYLPRGSGSGAWVVQAQVERSYAEGASLTTPLALFGSILSMGSSVMCGGVGGGYLGALKYQAVSRRAAPSDVLWVFRGRTSFGLLGTSRLLRRGVDTDDVRARRNAIYFHCQLATMVRLRAWGLSGTNVTCRACAGLHGKATGYLLVRCERLVCKAARAEWDASVYQLAYRASHAYKGKFVFSST